VAVYALKQPGRATERAQAKVQGSFFSLQAYHESLMFGGQQRQDGVRPAILRFSIGTVDSQMTFVSGCIGCLLIHVIAYVFNEAVNCVASDFRTPGVGLILPFDFEDCYPRKAVDGSDRLVNHPCTGGSPCPPRLHSRDIDSYRRATPPSSIRAVLHSGPGFIQARPRPSFRSNSIRRRSGRTAAAPAPLGRRGKGGR